jgi:hypothetical protein
MSVVSDSGEKLIEFRLVRSKRKSPLDYLGWAEIVVDPNVLTRQDICLVIPVGRSCFNTYFNDFDLPPGDIGGL